MRQIESRGGMVWTGAVLLMSLPLLAGCHKKVKAEFERPPAVSSIPEPVQTPSEPVELEPELNQTEPEPADELPQPEGNEQPPRPIRRNRPAPPPEPTPALDPPEPRLTSDEDSPEARSIVEKLTRAEAILSLLQSRSLTADQREQAGTARTFVTQARKALAERDYRRAAVLADKGLILAEDIWESSRVRRQ